MKDLLTEFLVILGRSTRAQWILVVGILFAPLAWFFGNHYIDGIELQGAMAPLTEAIQSALRDRYGSVALGMLATSVAAAAKTYRQDRRRLFQI